MSCFKKTSHNGATKTQSKESNRNHATTTLNTQTSKTIKQELSSTVVKSYSVINNYNTMKQPSLKPENANKSADFDNNKLIKQQSTKPESDQYLPKRTTQKIIKEENNDDDEENEKSLQRKKNTKMEEKKPVKTTKPVIDEKLYKNYEEVDEDKAKRKKYEIGQDFEQIKKIAPRQSILFMVKADGYGHGMIPVARFACVELGIKEFGCATIQEAMNLREELNDLEFDIYVFSDIQIELHENVDIYLKKRIIPVISNVSELEYLLTNPEFRNFPLCLKFNTGMTY